MTAPEHQTWIFDMDGTLSDSSWRLHHLMEEPRNWQAFFDKCEQDPPIEGVCTILRHLYYAGNRILILSGRNEESREKTVGWLQKHCLPGIDLEIISSLVTLRPYDSRMDDDIMKCQWVETFLQNNKQSKIIAAIDDRPRIIRAYRKMGLLVLDPGTWSEDK